MEGEGDDSEIVEIVGIECEIDDIGGTLVSIVKGILSGGLGLGGEYENSEGIDGYIFE